MFLLLGRESVEISAKNCSIASSSSLTQYSTQFASFLAQFHDWYWLSVQYIFWQCPISCFLLWPRHVYTVWFDLFWAFNSKWIHSCLHSKSWRRIKESVKILPTLSITLEQAILGQTFLIQNCSIAMMLWRILAARQVEGSLDALLVAGNHIFYLLLFLFSSPFFIYY